MRHYKNLLNESMSLTVFEMLTMLQGFLHEKFGIKAFGAKEDNGFVMYMSKYIGDEEHKDLTEDIKKFVEKECSMENVEVHKDNYGYHITFGHNAQAAKLIEVTQADASGIAGAKTTYKCAFCGEDHEGYGNDPWPVDMEPDHRVCDNCNNEVVIPARLAQLFKKENVNEAVERDQVEKDASNIVLDSRYTWLFNVLDKNGRDLEEGLENLQDAIDMLIKDNAAFLVAFPYVDPKPNDPTVELVFADNPGPVIIYNNEEVTVPKKQLERPTNERPEKPNRPERQKEEEEEVVEEGKSWETGSSKSDTKRSRENWLDIVSDVIDYLKSKNISSIEEVTENDMSKLTLETSLPAGDLESVLSFVFDYKKSKKQESPIIKSEQEDSETITEALEDEFVVAVDFTAIWYDAVDELEVDQEPYEAIQQTINSLEETLAYRGLFVSFDYVGQRQFDIVSNPMTRQEAKDVQNVLDTYLGEWSSVKVIPANWGDLS